MLNMATSLEAVRELVEKQPTEHSVSCELPALKKLINFQMKIISQQLVIHRVLDNYFQIKQKYQGKQIDNQR